MKLFLKYFKGQSAAGPQAYDYMLARLWVQFSLEEMNQWNLQPCLVKNKYIIINKYKK